MERCRTGPCREKALDNGFRRDDTNSPGEFYSMIHESNQSHSLPFPPFEMRELVGLTDAAYFDNPAGSPVFADSIELELYDNVLDFGCGCGRLARQMIQQRPRPRRYLGLDLHKGMVRWNQENLQPAAEGFEFQHHDVYNTGLNPSPAAPRTAPFPVENHSISLLVAWSVFTHLAEDQCEHYLREVARVLRPDGVMLSTWFLFDKSGFPMMQDFQNTLYINEIDPSNATIFDANWMVQLTSKLGLTIRSAEPPAVRGYHWKLQLTPTRPGVTGVELPADDAPVGRSPAPIGPLNASMVGLQVQSDSP
jgi:SAM-dependent methyltransferase